MERLKRAVTDGAIAFTVILSILPETPSGPVDLVVSIDFNSSVTVKKQVIRTSVHLIGSGLGE